MEVGGSSHSRGPSVAPSGVRAYVCASAKVVCVAKRSAVNRENDVPPPESGYSSMCSIPSFETFASVISEGIQSGLSSGAVCFQAHPS